MVVGMWGRTAVVLVDREVRVAIAISASGGLRTEAIVFEVFSV